jgi:hypothetical protein
MTVKTTSYITHTVFVFEVGYSVVTSMLAFYIRHNADHSINTRPLCCIWMTQNLQYVTAANVISMIQIRKYLVNISVCCARFYTDISVLLSAVSPITTSFFTHIM